VTRLAEAASLDDLETMRRGLAFLEKAIGNPVLREVLSLTAELLPMGIGRNKAAESAVLTARLAGTLSVTSEAFENIIREKRQEAGSPR
jgi:hypothetical protein